MTSYVAEVDDMLNTQIVQEHLFPGHMTVSGKSTVTARNKLNGAWGDSRDISLCEFMAADPENK